MYKCIAAGCDGKPARAVGKELLYATVSEVSKGMAYIKIHPVQELQCDPLSTSTDIPSFQLVPHFLLVNSIVIPVLPMPLEPCLSHSTKLNRIEKLKNIVGNSVFIKNV